MSYFVLLSVFGLFEKKKQDSLHKYDEEQFVQLKKVVFVQFPLTVYNILFN